jgi:oligoribonuclease
VPAVDLVETRILEWFDSMELQSGKFPMMGSSVHFDRGFLRVHMPRVESFFSFMNIDVSSIKNLIKIWEPDNRWFPKDRPHRALADVANTLDEASFYYNNFFNRSKNA